MNRTLAASKNPGANHQSFYAAILGTLDVSVAVSYAIGIESMVWHFSVLLIKLIIVLQYSGKNSVKASGFLILLICGLGITIDIVNGIEISAAAQIIGFFLGLCLTTLIVSRSNILAYFEAASIVLTFIAFVHLISCFAGFSIQTHGRFSYFTSHPNLGGEINAAASIMCIMAFGPKQWLRCTFMISVLLASSYLLQARAAIIVISMAFLICSIFKLGKGPQGLMLVCVGGIAGLVVLIYSAENLEFLSNALQLNSADRGTGSGFSGRDQRWGYALSTIAESPLFGKGAEYYKGTELSPHNFFLLALVQFGVVLGGGLIIVIVYYSAKIFVKDPYYGFCVSLYFALLLFNDRFMNLNPYPFAFYVTLCVLGGQSFLLLSRKKKVDVT